MVRSRAHSDVDAGAGQWRRKRHEEMVMAAEAQEHRQALREMVLMGLNRIVVSPAMGEYLTPPVYVAEIPAFPPS